MKIIVLLAIALSTSTTFAKSRKPASADGVCQTQAGEAVVGAVKGLGQDVSVESVHLMFVKGNHETYKVKLKGEGFSSAETNADITAKVWDMGDGCGLDSIEMPIELKLRKKNN